MGDSKMIKDKIIQMDNGKSYYVLEDVEYNEKKYILSVECDLDKDEVNEEDYFVMELDMAGDELAVKHIEDDKIAKMVIELLMDKIRKN